MREKYNEIYKKIKCNHLSIEKDYDNPNNYYNLIHMPTRINNYLDLCWQNVNNNFKINPDTGGFLCVIGYNDLKLNLDEYLKLVNKYISKAQNSNNPHCIRWCISLTYLCGMITNDIEYFKRCLEYDFTKFSPCILTKALSACLWLHKRTDNKEYLYKGVELYKKGLSCDFDRVFGYNKVYSKVAMTDFKKATDLLVEIGVLIDS